MFSWKKQNSQKLKNVNKSCSQYEHAWYIIMDNNVSLCFFFKYIIIKYVSKRLQNISYNIFTLKSAEKLTLNEVFAP